MTTPLVYDGLEDRLGHVLHFVSKNVIVCISGLVSLYHLNTELRMI